MTREVGCFVLDVGQGNATLIEGATGAVLVDAGPSRTAVVNFLEERSIDTLDAVFISHADADHVAGLIAVLSKANTDTGFTIRQVYVNPDGRDTKIWDDLTCLLDDMERRGRLTFTPDLGAGAPAEPLELGGCSVELLAPSKYMRVRGVDGNHRSGRQQTANSLSAVVLVTINQMGWILLPGDLDHLGLQDALGRNAWREAPVIVFPHHGGKAGTDAQTRELARLIVQSSKSDFVLFSGRSGTRKFPSAIVIDALLELAPSPTLISVGNSPVLEERIMVLHPCYHRSGEGTLSLRPPCAMGTISVISYVSVAPPTVFH